MNLALTQLLTGHGYFMSYLHQRDFSVFVEMTQWNIHFLNGQRWNGEMQIAERVIEGNINLDNLVTDMLATKEKWNAS